MTKIYVFNFNFHKFLPIYGTRLYYNRNDYKMSDRQHCDARLTSEFFKQVHHLRVLTFTKINLISKADVGLQTSFQSEALISHRYVYFTQGLHENYRRRFKQVV